MGKKVVDIVDNPPQLVSTPSATITIDHLRHGYRRKRRSRRVHKLLPHFIPSEAMDISKNRREQKMSSDLFCIFYLNSLLPPSLVISWFDFILVYNSWRYSTGRDWPLEISSSYLAFNLWRDQFGGVEGRRRYTIPCKRVSDSFLETSN